jgi:hypothetical protein
MSSGALDANRVEPKKEEGEEAAPRVPPAEPAEPAEQKGVKRKAGEMDDADATAAPEVEKAGPETLRALPPATPRRRMTKSTASATENPAPPPRRPLRRRARL